MVSIPGGMDSYKICCEKNKYEKSAEEYFLIIKNRIVALKNVINPLKRRVFSIFFLCPRQKFMG